MKLFAIIFAAIIAAFACIAWFISSVQARAESERVSIGYANDMGAVAERWSARTENLPQAIAQIESIRADVAKWHANEKRELVRKAQQKVLDDCDIYLEVLRDMQKQVVRAPKTK